MLIRFYVENFLSFRDGCFFVMTPGFTRRKYFPNHIIIDDSGPSDKKGKKIQALPITAIYGANASGKSNLLGAFHLVCRFVTSDHFLSNFDGWPFVPFLLSAETTDRPSKFEIVLKTKGIVYTYGFTVSQEKVLEEWLQAQTTPKVNTILFERFIEKDQTVIEFDSQLAELEKDGAGKWVPEKELFLTFATKAGKGGVHFQNVKHWFDHICFVFTPVPNGIGKLIYKNPDIKDFIAKFVKNADSGIMSIDAKEEKLNIEKMKELPFPKELLERLEEEKPSLYTITTQHQRDDGKEVSFPLQMESEGTRQFMELLPVLFMMKKTDQIFLVDELESSLHPLLAKWFLREFINSPNRRKNQLIFTTHDTNLLDRELLRGDEIWFVQKDEKSASSFTRLSEYENWENFNYERAYLNGRFGGIPFFQETEMK